MGSGFSSFLVMCSPSSSLAESPETGLGDLPESVVGSVLVHLSPQEICRFAGLNRAFRGASSADFVWESKLPENYGSRVWLHKGTGKPCLLICFNGLSITGIDDRRYWSRISTDESRFGSVAYLQQTWWFEVDGEVEFPLPVGTYNLYFRLQLGRPGKQFGRRVCNLDHIHGWDIKPIDCTHTKGGLCVDSVLICPK
ncbi:hypothetical protein E3N88_15999 [Mikania micrantha]|uniref:F-box domain-containing protein n=1 Tax=Mikania micrantha TaxID=192012 RepID=A0A5N6NX82_9ASTR|nr:hypothetical protein E3N88_15999 [Mikania micrantha]